MRQETLRSVLNFTDSRLTYQFPNSYLLIAGTAPSSASVASLSGHTAAGSALFTGSGYTTPVLAMVAGNG
jgi:hypothetical protein